MFAANWIMYVEPRFQKVRLIRDEVFIGEYGMTQEEAYDNRDMYAFHLLVTEVESGDPMATARIRPDDHDYDCTYVGDIAVREKYRKEGNYAEFALRMLLYKAQKLSGKTIIARIREDELPMYKKFGFRETERVNGKITVTVPRDEVLWPSECKGDD